MAYSYNTSVHSATNFAPAQLMFGSNRRIQIDILYGTVDEKINILLLILARQNISMKQMQYKTYYDQKIVDLKLEVNDLVYVYLPGLRNVKLVRKWSGPHKIVEVLHPFYIV